ncbi:MAG TPA: N-acetylmuramoyl-L-alanine amidase [Ignavibacteria bacterium]|nr:hypothetical protein [Bacteroidota bacterium]HRE10755.1 N-acetylmuramoyl-L-alanine amidase [Ignavibacteria bacterium]HRF66003.1 N-acetylmuramoyl-L-alanine amidase [Ignavibacteria bacterium]HRJ02844.1 N-acetylmuramoyl-L-alanine amidase [Ignavibacteria bacterium]HRJ84402.1 N-acetylmuramoyl-L-alanine amidase [Ignavibacteria bacterium]
MNVMYNGTSGKDERKWQQFLLSIGYKLPKFGADSFFGDETEEVTKLYQVKKKLVADGIVGRLTIEAAMEDGFKKVEVFTRRLDYITCHITAGNTLPQNWKWYHDLVLPDGSIKRGRDYNIISATIQGINQHIIGSSYVARGNDFDPNGKYGKYFQTPEQKDSYEKLFGFYIRKFQKNIKNNLRGHNDFAAKACPCFNVQLSPEFIEAVKYHAQNNTPVEFVS